jgi:UDP-glucose 4-epimerase
VTLEGSISRLVDGMRGMRFADAEFRHSPFIRLQVLQQHREAGRLTDDLVWRQGAEETVP